MKKSLVNIAHLKGEMGRLPERETGADGNGCEVLLLLRQVVWFVLVVELFLL
ncbi:hypothetical protein HMPREF0240_00003 [Clostridium sp. D5]|nr:hypothetical protein HMPREF0240_00003 [Clostridium sp. D5]